MSAHSALPIQPLLRIAEVQADLHRESTKTGFTHRVFADMIDASEKAVSRWIAAGTIPWVSADEAAIALGYHPILVWGDDWLNVKGDFDRLAAQAVREMQDDAAAFVASEATDY